MDIEQLKGRILFAPCQDIFYRVLSVFDKESKFEGMRRLKLLDLSNEAEHVSHFLESIGEDLHLVPETYPDSKIESYLQAAKAHSKDMPPLPRHALHGFVGAGQGTLVTFPEFLSFPDRKD